MQILQAGEIAIVNRSGETVPAGGLARIIGRDGTDPTCWRIGKPNAADLRNICVVPEVLPDGRKGIGLLPTHPRVVTHSLGSPPTPGVSLLGTASGSWLAAEGKTLLVWDGDSTTATVQAVSVESTGGGGAVEECHWLWYEGYANFQIIPGGDRVKYLYRMSWAGQDQDAGVPIGELGYWYPVMGRGESKSAEVKACVGWFSKTLASGRGIMVELMVVNWAQNSSGCPDANPYSASNAHLLDIYTSNLCRSWAGANPPRPIADMGLLGIKATFQNQTEQIWSDSGVLVVGIEVEVPH